ncbi:hypothetical protein ACJX0J_030380, partial [Zea mays]
HNNAITMNAPCRNREDHAVFVEWIVETFLFGWFGNVKDLDAQAINRESLLVVVVVHVQSLILPTDLDSESIQLHSSNIHFVRYIFLINCFNCILLITTYKMQ